MEKTIIRFVREKETTHTIRFKEVPAQGKPPVIGSLYVQKWLAEKANGVVIELTLE